MDDRGRTRRRPSKAKPREKEANGADRRQ